MNDSIFTPGAGRAQGKANRSNLRILDVDGERVIIVVNDYVDAGDDQAAAQAIVDSIRSPQIVCRTEFAGASRLPRPSAAPTRLVSARAPRR